MAAFTNPTSFIGVQAVGPTQFIGRINIFGTGNIGGGEAVTATGADNISVYTPATPMPEPSVLLLLGVGLAAAGLRWRRQP